MRLQVLCLKEAAGERIRNHQHDSQNSRNRPEYCSDSIFGNMDTGRNLRH